MKRVSIRSWNVSPVIAMTGALSIFASYSPFIRWMAPGPVVAIQAPNSPGMLGVTAGHEGSGLLVPYSDIADLVLAHADGLDQRAYSVTDHSEDDRHTPGDQRLDNDVGCRPVAWDAVGIRLRLHAAAG